MRYPLFRDTGFIGRLGAPANPAVIKLQSGALYMSARYDLINSRAWEAQASDARGSRHKGTDT